MSHGCFNRCWPKVSCPFKRICSLWLKGQHVYESGALEPAVCECELAARKWGSNHTGYSPIRLLSYAQSLAELFSISLYLSSFCHRFSFSILGVQTRLILWDFWGFLGPGHIPVVHLCLGTQCTLQWLSSVTSCGSCRNHCPPMLRVFILCAQNVLTHDEDISDAYCTVTYEGRGQTRVNEKGVFFM